MTVGDDRQPTTGAQRTREALSAALQYPYFWATALYLFYCSFLMGVSYCREGVAPDVWMLAPVPAPAPAQAPVPGLAPSVNLTSPAAQLGSSPPGRLKTWQWVVTKQCDNGLAYGTIQNQYVALGVIHVVSACLFAYSWRDWIYANSSRRAAVALALIPEGLNIASAGLYLASDVHYSPGYASCTVYRTCWFYKLEHRLELAAACISLFAAFFYTVSWWLAHVPGPGRGLTGWDVDLWAALLLIASNAVYVTYSAQVLAAEDVGWWGVHHDSTNFYLNELNRVGDAMYFVGACLYFTAALRDVGFWWWLPLPFYPKLASDDHGLQPPAAGGLPESRV